MAKLAEIGQVQGHTLLLNQNLVSTAEIATFSGINKPILDQYGSDGSAIKYSTENGKVYRVILKAKNPHSLLFSNGIEVTTLKLKQGINEFTFTGTGDDCYFIFLRKFASNTERNLTIDIQELNPPSLPLSVYTLGNASVNNLTQIYTLPTGGASVESLSKALGIDLNTDNQIEGSAVIFSGLANGKYQYNLLAEQAGTIQEDSDELVAYNGHQLVTLWKKNLPFVGTIDVVYGWVALIALDQLKSDPGLDFIVSNLTKIAELNYSVPQIISLIPNSKVGAIKVTDNETIVSSSIGSLPVNDSNFLLTIPSNVTDGVEGSYAEWMLESGDYSVEYYLRTTEKVTTQDKIYYYANSELMLLANRVDADIPIGNAGTTWVSDKMTLNVTVVDKLGFAVIDTATKTGTTELRITSIKKL